jgi:hypothetical protein
MVEAATMYLHAWLCLYLLAPLTASSIERAAPSKADVLAAYEARKAKTGRDAGAQVELALWCEANGLSAERTKHLNRAVLSEPDNGLARGLLGQLDVNGRWDDPDAARAAMLADEAVARTLAEYDRRRAELETRDRTDVLASAHEAKKNGEHARAQEMRDWYSRKTAPEHVKLGMWCEKNGLKAEAMAHFTQAVVLDPYRETTWKHLGYVKRDGRWISRDQAEAARIEAAAQQKADRYWEPQLRRWKAWLSEKSRLADAQSRLSEISEPRVVAAVMRVLGRGGESEQLVALEIFSRIESAAATRHIARLAVTSSSVKVRHGAALALRHREPRDYAGNLVDQIRPTMKYKVQPVGGPGSPGALLVETPRFKALRTYDAPPAFELGPNFFGYVGYDPNGLPVVVRGRELMDMARKSPGLQAAQLAAIEARTMQMLNDANIKAANSQQSLVADVQAIEAQNADSAAGNAVITQVLKSALDDVPSSLKDDDENGWHTWWFDKLGYRYETPPQTQIQFVDTSPQYPPPRVYSCFAAGTLVRTRDGRKPIETVLVGDQVLTQDVTNGSLGFHPVTVLHHNAPSATIRVVLDNGDALVASIYHRFWLAGVGWKMARELRRGDTLRALNGVAKIVSAEPGEVVPVYNLDVALARTFFVGNHDALVHDNTLPDPRQKAFDLVAK